MDQERFMSESSVPELTREPRDSVVLGKAADDSIAGDLRSFGPLGIIAIVVVLVGNALFVPLSAILVLVWARLSDTPWRALGFVRPRSWPRTIAGGVLFGAVLKLTMKAVVMPVFGAPPINHTFHHLAGNTAAIPAALYMIVVGAAFGEETVFRAFAFERLRRLLGWAPAAKVAIVLLTSAWFGIEHYSLQGLPGVQQATMVGLILVVSSLSPAESGC
jgi:membrane protease YdiL (CAAX protease family)